MIEFPGLDVRSSWGERAYFYNPGGKYSHGVYFLTVKERDGANDRASALDRLDVWRMNFGLPKSEYDALFGPPPPRPAMGGVVQGPWDFTRLDELMPHPIYACMNWVCMLSPGRDLFETSKPLITISYTKALQTERKRQR